LRRVPPKRQWPAQAKQARQKIQAKTGASAYKASATRYEKVSDLITTEKQQRLVHITLNNSKRITATDGHPLRTSEGWRDAVLLKKGNKLLLMGSGDGDGEGDDASAGAGPATPATATIEDVRIETKTIRVYNLEVANLHTFFVGEDGVVVHNATSKGGAVWSRSWRCAREFGETGESSYRNS
jgi:hypothetical protein